MEQEAYRHVPYDIDVEQALLGAILADNRAMERASALIKPEHFYDPLHGRIFETMSHMIERSGVVVTPLTLHATMKADPGVIETGGQAYFDALRAAAPAIPNIKDYSNILADLATRRSLIRIGEDIVNTAYDAPTEKTSKDQIAEAVGAFLRRDSRIKTACETYGGMVDRETELTILVSRLEKAAELYSALHAHTQSTLNSCYRIRENLNAARKQFEDYKLPTHADCPEIVPPVGLERTVVMPLTRVTFTCAECG